MLNSLLHKAHLKFLNSIHPSQLVNVVATAQTTLKDDITTDHNFYPRIVNKSITLGKDESLLNKGLKHSFVDTNRCRLNQGNSLH